jgi:hypothetical protein
MREEFLERLRDPSIYSLRSEIALIDLNIGRLLEELRLYGEEAPAGSDSVEEVLAPSRITKSEAGLFAQLQEAVELRMKLVAAEVKTLEVLGTATGRQNERTNAMIAIVVEVLRGKLSGSPAGRATLMEVAEELEQRLRQLQEQQAGLLPSGPTAQGQGGGKAP